MSRPIIGLPGRRKKGHQVAGYPGPLGRLDLDLYGADYARAVYRAGGLPIHLPFDVDPAEYAELLDGLVLPGGADVDPALYGEQPETNDFPAEPARDAFEMALLDDAERRTIPVLGICRGIQLLNVRAGGSLHQHDDEHGRFDLDPATELHTLAIEPGSRLADFYDQGHTVNSLHHQTVKALGDGYVVTARSEDGNIEAIEHESLPIIAVQWHPEMMESAPSDPIFSWLVEAATAR